MRTYKLHLIRHGLTKANLNGVYCGTTDIPLDEVGVAALHELLDEATYPYAEWVFSSPLARARETAEILYPSVEVIEIENLREASFGIYEGRSMEELKDDPDFARFAAGDPAFLPEGAEEPAAFHNRSAAAAAAIIDMMMKGGVHDAAIVTHAGVIGNILSALAFPKAAPYEWNPGPGSGYTAIVDPTLYSREPVIEVVRTLPEFEERAPDGDASEWDDFDWEDEELDELLK